MFSQISQEVKKTRALKIFNFYIWGLDFEEILHLTILYRSADITDLALKNIGIGLKALKHLQYLKIRMVE